MSQKTILIVDDERKIVDILHDFLTMEGFEVRKTYDGQEALDLLNKGTRIDLALVDEKMPVMGGTALLKRMRKMGVSFPVIFFTGSLNLLQLAGPDRDLYENLLIKPVRLSELLETINKVLKADQKRNNRRKKCTGKR